MLSVAVLLMCASLVLGQTTVTTSHRPHHHPSPVPHETHSFNYAGKTHQLVLKTHTTCYIMTLNHHEQHQVHSPAGLHKLEGHLLAAVDKTAAHAALDPTKADPHIAHFCRDHQKNTLPLFTVN